MFKTTLCAARLTGKRRVLASAVGWALFAVGCASSQQSDVRYEAPPSARLPCSSGDPYLVINNRAGRTVDIYGGANDARLIGSAPSGDSRISLIGTPDARQGGTSLRMGRETVVFPDPTWSSVAGWTSKFAASKIDQSIPTKHKGGLRTLSGNRLFRVELSTNTAALSSIIRALPD